MVDTNHHSHFIQIRANYQLVTKERRRVPNTRIPPSIQDDLAFHLGTAG